MESKDQTFFPKVCATDLANSSAETSESKKKLKFVYLFIYFSYLTMYTS